MIRPDRKFKLRKLFLAIAAIGSILLACIIPFKLALSFYQYPEPVAILVLGGDFQRINQAARFSKSHPNLEIWISDYYINFSINQNIFENFGVPARTIHYDFCATDTVTNFTCTVNDFVKQRLKHIYLITSDYHMRRARAIATIVFGSRGIFVSAISIPSQKERSESLIKVARDVIRSLIWLVTGRTGASLNPALANTFKQST